MTNLGSLIFYTTVTSVYQISSIFFGHFQKHTALLWSICCPEMKEGCIGFLFIFLEQKPCSLSKKYLTLVLSFIPSSPTSSSIVELFGNMDYIPNRFTTSKVQSSIYDVQRCRISRPKVKKLNCVRFIFLGIISTNCFRTITNHTNTLRKSYKIIKLLRLYL